MPAQIYPPISNAPYSVTGKSAPIKNNGGTLFYGGTIANTANSSMGLSYLGYRSGISSPTPYAGITTGAVIGLSAGKWQSMTPGRYVLLTFCSQLAGTTNTILNSPSSYGQKGGQNLFSGTIRTPRYMSTGGWYYQTGWPVSKPIYNATTPAWGIGDPPVLTPFEQYPGTRAIPGRIFYIAAGLLPTVTNYKAKTD